MALQSFFRWTALALGLAATIFWIVMFILEGIDSYLIPGILLILTLAVITFIAWQSEAIGGALFIIVGIIYTIIMLVKDAPSFYFFAIITILAPSAINLLSYYYSEKKDREESDF